MVDVAENDSKPTSEILRALKILFTEGALINVRRLKADGHMTSVMFSSLDRAAETIEKAN